MSEKEDTNGGGAWERDMQGGICVENIFFPPVCPQNCECVKIRPNL